MNVTLPGTPTREELGTSAMNVDADLSQEITHLKERRMGCAASTVSTSSGSGEENHRSSDNGCSKWAYASAGGIDCSRWCFLGNPRPPVFDGAGVLWVLTGTHQRAVTSRQGDVTAERQPFCGW